LTSFAIGDEGALVENGCERIRVDFATEVNIFLVSQADEGAGVASDKEFASNIVRRGITGWVIRMSEPIDDVLGGDIVFCSRPVQTASSNDCDWTW
jgi:hypothetical protein